MSSSESEDIEKVIELSLACDGLTRLAAACNNEFDEAKECQQISSISVRTCVRWFFSQLDYKKWLKTHSILEIIHDDGSIDGAPCLAAGYFRKLEMGTEETYPISGEFVWKSKGMKISWLQGYYGGPMKSLKKKDLVKEAKKHADMLDSTWKDQKNWVSMILFL